MRFVPTADYVYPWPIKMVLPSQDAPGEVVEQEFVGKFRLSKDDEALAIAEALRSAAEAGSYVEATKSQIRKVLVGWDESTMLGINDAPVPFSTDTLEEYLTSTPFRVAVVKAYGESLNKRPAEGN